MDQQPKYCIGAKTTKLIEEENMEQIFMILDLGMVSYMWHQKHRQQQQQQNG